MLIRRVSLPWNGNVIIILMKFSSLAAPEVVKMTTSGAASNKNLVKMITFPFPFHKKASQARISNCIPQNTVGCNYLSMPEIPGSGSKVLIHPIKYALCLVMFCFAVVISHWLLVDSYDYFTHIIQGCFPGTGAIVGSSKCQCNKPEEYL